MGAVGAIPFEAVDAYADRYGIKPGDDFDEFYTLVRAADLAWLEEVNRDRGSGRRASAKGK